MVCISCQHVYLISKKNMGNLTDALSLNFLLCLCHGHTNMDSFNVLFIVNSYSLLMHFSKQKAGDLISYTFLWTASMLVPNGFKVYFISCKRLLMVYTTKIKCSKVYVEYLGKHSL